jgi:eukaryotic-like serine/threonine-protein kinase
MSLTSGSKLGPYEIQSQLGAGGMGEVYRARDTRLERTVAIKVLRDHFSQNAELKQRFEREARAISSLNHPNICTLYDIGNQDGTEYLVMEYLEGETLSSRLARGTLPLRETLKIGMEVADALDKAHRGGIIHRDLKPGNVMLTKGGAKLLDFGLAKSAHPSVNLASDALTSPVNPATVPGMVMGTFQYMSPEQIAGQEADARSDIFSFGALLYEMATGKRAFEGKSQLSVASAILEKDPEPISSVQPTTPAVLDHVVRTCLAKSPDDRFQTAHDVKLQLKWITDASTSAMPAVARTRRLATRRVLIGAAAFSGLLALVAVFLVLSLNAKLRDARQPISAEINAPAGADFGAAVMGAAAISPDGKHLVFVAGDSKSRKLWLRDLSTGRTESLTGTEDALFPFWSPDSRFVAFFAVGKLDKISIDGGPVQIICDAVEGRGGSWSPNGTIIFTPNITEPLYGVLAGGGTPQKLTNTKPGWTHRNPYFLPDGEHFLFISREPSGTATAGSLYVASLKAAEPKLLLDRASNVAYSGGYLLYFKDGNLVAQGFDSSALTLTGDPVPIAERVDYWNARDSAYFSASPTGVLVYRQMVQTPTQPTWVDREGRELGKVGEPGIYQSPTLSRDGSKLAVARAGKDPLRFDIWITDVQHNSSSRATLVDSPQVASAFSPEGNTIAVSADLGGARGALWTQSVSGSGAQDKIVDTPIWIVLSDWSNDGRYLTGDVQENTTREDVFFVDLKGDRKLTKFLQSPASEQNAHFSPNGKWLAYISDESGRFELYVAAFPGPGGKWAISNSGLDPLSPSAWSADGKELYYQSSGKIMAVPITNTDSFQFGTPQPLSIPTGDISGFTPGPTPGRFLVLRRSGQPEAVPIHLVLNWTQTLKK